MSSKASRQGVGTGKSAATSVTGHGPSSFVDALVVPQLAHACYHSNCWEGDSDHGLKRLRLVSKGVREVLQRVLHVYTLMLRNEAQGDLHLVVKFLKSIDLLRLKIMFPKLGSADTHAMDAAHSHHSTQLNSFVMLMGPALARVTDLHITLQCMCGPGMCEAEENTAMSMLLPPLAASFPRLVKLAVSGRVGPSFFQAFGSLCPKLTSLHAALSNLTTSTLQQLPTLLPNLTSMGVLSALVGHDDGYGNWSDEDDVFEEVDKHFSNAAACILLRACPNLRFFDTTTYNMTAEVWAVLPLGLLGCTTAGVERKYNAPLPAWKEHTALKTLKNCGLPYSVQDLAQLLTSAPNVSTIVSARSNKYKLSMTREDALLPEALGIVNFRLNAGLNVLAMKPGILETSRSASTVMDFHSWMSNHISAILSASMPPSPGFTAVRFGCRGLITTADLIPLPRIFPNLRDVKLWGMTLDPGTLQALVACQALRSVKMTCCGGVTFEGVAALCAASMSLRQVTCRHCKDLSARDGRVMQRKGWGGIVKVSVT